MPVRKISKRSSKVVGDFPSHKLKRMVAFESLIERDFILLLDFAKNVSHYEEQPLTIHYQDGNKKRRYTPDFHVIENGQHYLVECKAAKRTQEDDNQLKFEVGSLWCQEHGYQFRVVTETGLRTGFRLENVRLLTDYSRYIIDVGLKVYIFSTLKKRGCAVSISELVEAAPTNKPSSTLTTILNMAFNHEVFIPLDTEAISTTTLVTLPISTSLNVLAE